MNNAYYILKDKKVVAVDSVVEWAKSFESTSRQVAIDVVDDIKISTVFLGLDHRFEGEGEPIVFETMIFGGEHDQYQERYCTWNEAVEGHKKAVELVSLKSNL